MYSLDRLFGSRMRALALFAALALAPQVACAATGAGGAAEPSTAAQADLIARLPADATTVGFVDFSAIRDSAIYAYLRDQAISGADPEDLEQLLGGTGIDLATDVHRIAFVSNAGLSGLGAEETTGIIVLASFDRQRIIDALSDNETAEYNGTTLYQLARWRDRGDADDEDDADGEDRDDVEIELDFERAYVAILDDSTVAFGSETMLRGIVDVAGGAPSARTNNRIMRLLEDVDPDSQVWAISAQNGLLSDLQPGNNDIPMGQIPVDRINALIVSLQLDDSLHLRLRGRTEAQEDAKLLGDSLNGMLAFGKMMLQGNSPEVFGVLDRGLSAGSSGRDVTIRADLTVEDLQILRAYGEEVAGSSGIPGMPGF